MFWRMTILITCWFAIAGCGDRAMQRASSEPWSSSDQSATRNTDGLPAQRPVVPMVVSGKTVYNRAMGVLTQAASAEDPRLRANAVEALREGPADALRGASLVALGDENRGVRFVAAVTVGDAELCDLATLLEPLLLDESLSVRTAAMYALHRCGQSVDLSLLAMMLASDEPEWRANAAMVLGRLGNPSAVSMLRAAVQKPMRGVSPIRRRLVNLQMAEALVQLGERQELETIRAAIFSSAEEAEATALACQIAGRLGDKDVSANLRDLAAGISPGRHGDEVRLVAAGAVAELAPTAVPIDAVLPFTSHHEPGLRAQAAAVLGSQGNQLNLGPLAVLLADEDPLVQVAAASAVLQILDADALATAD